MLFSSLFFVFYFLPISLMIYWLLSFSRVAQNVWLFIVSIIFYAWGGLFFAVLMLGSILVNWTLGLIAGKMYGQKRKIRMVIVSTCIVNLGLLFVFKYLGFAVSNINALFGGDVIAFKGLALPLGISFFTFQAMSYVLDVARGDAKAEKNPFYVGLYVALFPQLVAGPIVKYTDIAAQMRTRKVTVALFSDGCKRFIAGFAKKILIANNMAIIVDHIYNLNGLGISPYTPPVTLAWLGLIAYTFQIFFDFSGYSDMAIGIGKMFGFEFKENFNYPYISSSVVEFWRRWHISLSTWFREYVYFSLGGSRVRSGLILRNTFIVWLLTGIWHGAEWTFVIWGLWYFAFIILERITKFDTLPISKPVRHLYLLIVVVIGWGMFRAPDFYQFGQYMLNAFGLNGNGFFSATALMFLREYWVFFLAAIVCSTPVLKNFGTRIKAGTLGIWGKIYAVLLPVAYMLIFVIGVTYLTKGSYNPFIYFNF
jgi:alginate O-acetyltransferase complex protein AlgI